MKVFVAVFAMFAAMVASQASVGSLPSCAIPCVQSGIGATGCAATDVHCFCTASQFLATVAPCIFANCSTADQNATETAAQKICNAANPPVQLPSFGSLLNASSTSTASHASSTASAASSVGAGVPTAAASSATSASGRIEGNMRVMMAIAAMVGIIAVAFFAV